MLLDPRCLLFRRKQKEIVKRYVSSHFHNESLALNRRCATDVTLYSPIDPGGASGGGAHSILSFKWAD